ncbi:ABC transporter permease [Nonlabens dokdonensis]|uniref:ABC transporter permease n=1 Tax=Nonlabens dokdonensis TaxID=328515 RepID=A0A1Z8AVS7_9FLAO|nr:ABC transporter permease [Nonlabens dokdonensis]OUS14434.1 ABC transporter permease [Nonlabens dokdonensis]
MKRLLDIEFHKFKYSTSSKVLTIIYLIIVVAAMFIGLYEINIDGKAMKLADLNIFDFPFIWHLSTYLLSFLKFLIAIVIVSLMANEYSNRTLKQNLIDGLSKKELIISKFYFILFFTLILTVLVFLVCLILGLLYSDINEFNLIFRDVEYIGAFFVSHLAFFCMCLFAGVLVKRSAFALGLIGIWGIFELIIFGLSSYLDFKFGWSSWDFLRDVLPLNTVSNLIVEPFSKVSLVKTGLETLSQSEFEKEYGVRWINVIMSSIWSALFVYWSYAILKKRDL